MDCKDVSAYNVKCKQNPHRWNDQSFCKYGAIKKKSGEVQYGATHHTHTQNFLSNFCEDLFLASWIVTMHSGMDWFSRAMELTKRSHIASVQIWNYFDVSGSQQDGVTSTMGTSFPFFFFFGKKNPICCKKGFTLAQGDISGNLKKGIFSKTAAETLAFHGVVCVEGGGDWKVY